MKNSALPDRYFQFLLAGIVSYACYLQGIRLWPPAEVETEIRVVMSAGWFLLMIQPVTNGNDHTKYYLLMIQYAVATGLIRWLPESTYNVISRALCLQLVGLLTCWIFRCLGTAPLSGPVPADTSKRFRSHAITGLIPISLAAIPFTWLLLTASYHFESGSQQTKVGEGWLKVKMILPGGETDTAGFHSLYRDFHKRIRLHSAVDQLAAAEIQQREYDLMIRCHIEPYRQREAYAFREWLLQYATRHPSIHWGIQGLGPPYSNVQNTEWPAYRVRLYAWHPDSLNILQDELETLLLRNPRVQQQERKDISSTDVMERVNRHYFRNLSYHFTGPRLLGDAFFDSTIRRFNAVCPPGVYADRKPGLLDVTERRIPYRSLGWLLPALVLSGFLTGMQAMVVWRIWMERLIIAGVCVGLLTQKGFLLNAGFLQALLLVLSLHPFCRDGFSTPHRVWILLLVLSLVYDWQHAMTRSFVYTSTLGMELIWLLSLFRRLPLCALPLRSGWRSTLCACIPRYREKETEGTRNV